MIEIPESANSLDAVREILKEEHSMKHIDNCKLFNSEGNEVSEGTLILIKDKEIVYLEPQPDRPFDYANILEQYKILGQVGEGGFGQVHKAQHKITQQIVAIKYIDITSCSILWFNIFFLVYHASKVDEIYREAQALKKLSHPNIVKLYNAFLWKNNVVLIMEYVAGGEIYKYVKDKGGLSELEARNFFMQLTDAVEYCHNKYVIHRDLKPTNILLSDGAAGMLKV